jgi:hypothetical protein
LEALNTFFSGYFPFPGVPDTVYNRCGVFADGPFPGSDIYDGYKLGLTSTTTFPPYLAYGVRKLPTPPGVRGSPWTASRCLETVAITMMGTLKGFNPGGVLVDV